MKFIKLNLKKYSSIFFSKLYKYIKEKIFNQNFYSEKDLISISKVSEKAENLIKYSNM